MPDRRAFETSRRSRLERKGKREDEMTNDAVVVVVWMKEIRHCRIINNGKRNTKRWFH